jgi:hypothetical protein
MSRQHRFFVLAAAALLCLGSAGACRRSADDPSVAAKPAASGAPSNAAPASEDRSKAADKALLADIR